MGSKVTISSKFYHVLPGTNSQQEYNLDNAENVILIDDLQALHGRLMALHREF